MQGEHTERKYRIAVDLGATKILVGIIDNANNILAKKQILTEASKGFENAMNNLVQVIHALLEECAIDKQYCQVGICAPGPISIETGEMVNSVNFNWGRTPLRDFLKNKLSLPVAVEHDAKASALGEFHYGVGKGETSMVYIVVGSGVGGAIILDGKIYRGLHNYAGEVGHITIDYDGDPGATGIKGNAQSFMAGPSLAYHYKQLLKKAGRQLPEEQINGKYVGNLARNNDELALEVVRNAGKALGVLIGTLTMVLDIDLYVIGSSVAKLGDIFLEPARKEVYNYAFEDLAKNIKIVSSTLGDDAALLGCAHMLL